jgi:hypothetical protein
LVAACRAAGVRRIVHISVANASEASALPYFRGKGAVEQLVRRCGLSYAVLLLRDAVLTRGEIPPGRAHPRQAIVAAIRSG